MCGTCEQLLSFFHRDAQKDHSEAYKNYISAVKALCELTFTRKIEFIAGDCLLGDIEKCIASEKLFSVNHYFRCKCGRIFYVGYCIRGTPICEIVRYIPIHYYYWGGRKFGSWDGKSPVKFINSPVRWLWNLLYTPVKWVLLICVITALIFCHFGLSYGILFVCVGILGLILWILASSSH